MKIMGRKDWKCISYMYGENDWMDYRGGLDVQRLCHEMMQDSRTTTTTTRSAENNQSPPPKVFVHGVRNAGHLLMLENYQEFNAAMAIAAGREEDLPPGMSRSVEFVCDEVAAANAEGTTSRSSRKKVVMSEKDAAKFFRGGRFNRRESEQQKDDDTVIVEEKKE